MLSSPRLSHLLAVLPRDRMIVVDLDDDVEAVEVPGDIVARVQSAYPPHEEDRLLELIALMIVRLGGDTAVPAVRGWIDTDPGILLRVPPETRRQLAFEPDAIGPLLGGPRSEPS